MEFENNTTNSLKTWQKFRFCKIIVKYEVGGVTYKKVSNTYTDSPECIGANDQIKYNPSNPSGVIFVNDDAKFIILLVGGCFILIGIILILKEY